MKIGKNYIGGSWIEGDEYIKTIDPNTGKPLGKIIKSDQNMINLAIKSARESLHEWKTFTVEARSKILRNAVDILISEYGEEGKPTPLKELISMEVGKRLPEADIEVIESSDMVSYYSDSATNFLSPRQLELDKELWPTKSSKVLFEPKGVVAIIKAWNYPLEVPIWSIAPALAAGNTIVFKPSEHSSFVGLELARIFDKAGIPKGVFNVITGDGRTGELLVNSRGIDMVSFTGSIKTGKEIERVCQSNGIKSILELSGNDAAIVLKDADSELTSNGLVWGAFCNSGQVCVGVKRAFVHESVFESVLEKTILKTKDLKPKVEYGPIISLKQLESIKLFVNDAKTKGGKILTGGNEIESIDGYYFEPTIIVDVTDDMLLMQEECFGPLLPLIKFSSLEKAIHSANNTKYGLGASIWTENTEKAEEIASQLEVGMVWVNDVNVAYPQAPWGGIKSSGSGIDLSEFSLYEYTNIKHLNFDNSKDQRRAWWYPYKSS